MVLAGFLAAALTAAPGLDDMIAEIDRLILSGRPMPAALLLDVRRLPSPEERMQAVIYLRRSGLLTGAPLSLDELVFLRPKTLAPIDAPDPEEGSVDED